MRGIGICRQDDRKNFIGGISISYLRNGEESVLYCVQHKRIAELGAMGINLGAIKLAVRLRRRTLRGVESNCSLAWNGD
jgi:hypothetical protein